MCFTINSLIWVVLNFCEDISNNSISLRIDVIDDTVCKINGDDDIVGPFANTKPKENPIHR